MQSGRTTHGHIPLQESKAANQHDTLPPMEQPTQEGKEQSELVTSQQRALDPGLCWHLAGICSIVTNYVIDKQMAILQQSPGFMLISPSASLLLSQVFSESASLTSQWS